jgi:phage shock protein A
MTRFSVSSAMVACLLAATSNTEAFSPALRSKSAFIPSYSAMSSGATMRSSTCLNMNLFDRFSRVAKSNLNNVLKKMEDPEKIMGQALEDMQVGTVGWLSCYVCVLWIGSRRTWPDCIYFLSLSNTAINFGLDF